MKYRSYMHIEKLGTGEVENILYGTTHLFYKLDGTNAVVWLQDDGTVGFGSRNRELSDTEDNYNFLKSITSSSEIYDDLLDYLTKHSNHIIYGEWLVKHTLRTYKEDAWKKFYVFDIFDADTERYINYDVYSKELEDNYSNITFIPRIAKLENATKAQLQEALDKSGEFLVTEGKGEGIVIKNYEFVNSRGNIKWAKLLTEDFNVSKGRTRTGNKFLKDNAPIEYEIIKLMTEEHILKEKSKIAEARDGWTLRSIPELLNRAFNEFWRDNWELILKKFRNATINFGILKKLSDDKVKEVIGI